MSSKDIVQEKIQRIKSDIYGAFREQQSGDISNIDLSAKLSQSATKLIELGRMTVLRDFQRMCAADAFMGFSKDEWEAIQKFFAFNNLVAGVIDWEREIDLIDWEREIEK